MASLFPTLPPTRHGSKPVPKGAGSHLTDERCQQIGLRGVESMNRRAKHPHMEPQGARKPALYVLGEAPSSMDDRKGKQFTGRKLQSAIPQWLRNRVRYNNVCRTYPTGGRTPNRIEIECYRPSVAEDIAAAKPKVVLALGLAAMRWVLPTVANVQTSRGRLFPVCIAGHHCWLATTFAPGYVQAMQSNKERMVRKIPGREIDKAFKRDIADVCQKIKMQRLGKPKVMKPTDPALFANVTLLRGGQHDLDVLRAFLTDIASEKYVAADIETTALRPFGNGRMLSLSFGVWDSSISIAFDHTYATWTPAERKTLKKLLRGFFLNKQYKVFHNLSFDLEWLAFILGEELVAHKRWHDTMQQAYVLDVRQDGHSLDFLTLLHMGLPVKQVMSLDRKNLESYPLTKLLQYNAIDVKTTIRVFHAQRALLKAMKLDHVYRKEQLPRVFAIVSAQLAGVNVSRSRVLKFKKRYCKREKNIQQELAARPEVRKYQARFGVFNPAANKDVERLFKTVLGHKQKGNKYSTDKGALAEIGGRCAELVLELRTVSKMRSTYIDKLDRTEEGSVVWPDNCIHTSFNTTFTRTGRLSSNNPNLQNYPKRDPDLKRIRYCFKAPPGHVLISADYGQIEARVIGMASQDENLVRSLWDNYDIHMYWAERLAKPLRGVLRKRYGTGSHVMKAFRGDVKNQLVFPAFFGAGLPSIARALGSFEQVMAPYFEEFWEQFPQVKLWQQKLERGYNKNFYVECLTGRRRYGPMGRNTIINTPVQGTASDILAGAMYRMYRLSVMRDKPWLRAVMNIHDDLTFVVPIKKQDYAIQAIAETMCDVPYKWVHTPISVEIERGGDWLNMKEVGTYHSNELFEETMPAQYAVAA